MSISVRTGLNRPAHGLTDRGSGCRPDELDSRARSEFFVEVLSEVGFHVFRAASTRFQGSRPFPAVVGTCETKRERIAFLVFLNPAMPQPIQASPLALNVRGISGVVERPAAGSPSAWSASVAPGSPPGPARLRVFSSASAPGSSFSAAPGQGPVILKAAVTCAGLGIVGDVAQTIANRSSPRRRRRRRNPAARRARAHRPPPRPPPRWTWSAPPGSAVQLRLLRPRALLVRRARGFLPDERRRRARRQLPFAAKVFLNQAVLGPVVVTTFFAWTFALQGKMAEYPEKIRRDTLPTLKRGWAFWVPAASVNFAVVPLRFQVLYMSCCSIVWNYILSTAAGKNNQPAPVAAKKGR